MSDLWDKVKSSGKKSKKVDNKNESTAAKSPNKNESTVAKSPKTKQFTSAAKTVLKTAAKAAVDKGQDELNNFASGSNTVDDDNEVQYGVMNSLAKISASATCAGITAARELAEREGDRVAGTAHTEELKERKRRLQRQNVVTASFRDQMTRSGKEEDVAKAKRVAHMQRDFSAYEKNLRSENERREIEMREVLHDIDKYGEERTKAKIEIREDRKKIVESAQLSQYPRDEREEHLKEAEQKMKVKHAALSRHAEACKLRVQEAQSRLRLLHYEKTEHSRLIDETRQYEGFIMATRKNEEDRKVRSLQKRVIHSQNTSLPVGMKFGARNETQSSEEMLDHDETQSSEDVLDNTCDKSQDESREISEVSSPAKKTGKGEKKILSFSLRDKTEARINRNEEEEEEEIANRTPSKWKKALAFVKRKKDKNSESSDDTNSDQRGMLAILKMSHRENRMEKLSKASHRELVLRQKQSYLIGMEMELSQKQKELELKAMEIDLRDKMYDLRLRERDINHPMEPTSRPYILRRPLKPPPDPPSNRLTYEDDNGSILRRPRTPIEASDLSVVTFTESQFDTNEQSTPLVLKRADTASSAKNVNVTSVDDTVKEFSSEYFTDQDTLMMSDAEVADAGTIIRSVNGGNVLNTTYNAHALANIPSYPHGRGSDADPDDDEITILHVSGEDDDAMSPFNTTRDSLTDLRRRLNDSVEEVGNLSAACIAQTKVEHLLQHECALDADDESRLSDGQYGRKVGGIMSDYNKLAKSTLSPNAETNLIAWQTVDNAEVSPSTQITHAAVMSDISPSSPDTDTEAMAEWDRLDHVEVAPATQIARNAIMRGVPLSSSDISTEAQLVAAQSQSPIYGLDDMSDSNSPLDEFVQENMQLALVDPTLSAREAYNRHLSSHSELSRSTSDSSRGIASDMDTISKKVLRDSAVQEVCGEDFSTMSEEEKDDVIRDLTQMQNNTLNTIRINAEIAKAASEEWSTRNEMSMGTEFQNILQTAPQEDGGCIDTSNADPDSATSLHSMVDNRTIERPSLNWGSLPTIEEPPHENEDLEDDPDLIFYSSVTSCPALGAGMSRSNDYDTLTVPTSTQQSTQYFATVVEARVEEARREAEVQVTEEDDFGFDLEKHAHQCGWNDNRYGGGCLIDAETEEAYLQRRRNERVADIEQNVDKMIGEANEAGKTTEASLLIVRRALEARFEEEWQRGERGES